MKRLLAGFLAALMLPSPALAQSADEAAFRALYKELVETNTTFSVGDCTLLADKIATRFKAAMDEDLATPEAVAVLFDLAAEVNRSKNSRLAGLLKALGGILGLLQSDPKERLQAGASVDCAAIDALIAQRAFAKQSKNFSQADQIRKELLEKGIVLKDSPTGTTWENVQ